MARFDSAIETALRLIQKNGQKVTWQQSLVVVPDATKPWLPAAGTVALHEPFICFLPLDREGKEFLIKLGATEVNVGMFYGLMGNVSFTPDPKDVVTRDGIVLDIAHIDLLSPNGQKVLWTITFNG